MIQSFLQLPFTSVTLFGAILLQSSLAEVLISKRLTFRRDVAYWAVYEAMNDVVVYLCMLQELSYLYVSTLFS